MRAQEARERKAKDMMKKFRFDQFPGFVVLDFNDACSIVSSLKKAAKANHGLDNILKSHPVWFATYRHGTLRVYVLAHEDVWFPLQEGQQLFKTILSAREVDIDPILRYLGKYHGHRVNQAMLDAEMAVGLEVKLHVNANEEQVLYVVDVDVGKWEWYKSSFLPKDITEPSVGTDVKCSTLNAVVYRFDGIRGLTKIEGTSDEIEEQLPAIFEAIHRRLPENCYVDRFPGCKSFQVRNSDNRVILVARHVDYNGIMAYLSKYQGQQVNQARLDKELAIGLELKLRGNDIVIVDVDVDEWEWYKSTFLQRDRVGHPNVS
jgi:hypothetical protein